MGESHKMITSVAITRRALGMAIIVYVTKKITNDNPGQRLFDQRNIATVRPHWLPRRNGDGDLRNPHWLTDASGKEGAIRHRPSGTQ